MRLAVSYPQKNVVHTKVASLKFRLSSKRIEAGYLFTDVINENVANSSFESPLKTIRDSLINQQKSDGTYDAENN